jgi:hypothetical protein
LLGIHASLDDLDSDQTFDWLGLLGHEHAAHATLANGLQQFVFAGENRADRLDSVILLRLVNTRCGLRQETAWFVVGVEQRLDAAAQFRVPSALAVEERGALDWRSNLQGGQEDGLNTLGIYWHGKVSVRLHLSMRRFGSKLSKKMKKFTN